jgi:hypothetical protein
VSRARARVARRVPLPVMASPNPWVRLLGSSIGWLPVADCEAPQRLHRTRRSGFLMMTSYTGSGARSRAAALLPPLTFK